MDSRIAELIEQCKADCLAGVAQSRETIIELLEVDPQSAEAQALRDAANELSHEISAGQGFMWGAIGLDFKPCGLDCAFCSFGTKWGIITEERVLTDEEVIAHATTFAKNNVDFITLRSTEFYSLDTIARQVKLIRDNVPGDYKIIVNVGEMDVERATQLHEAGVWAAYHVVRLREGTDTPFDPQVRINTVRSIAASPLELASCLEPIGTEHTNEELADHILIIAENRALISGVMARIPVPGTPLGDIELIGKERLSQVLAVMRLCTSRETAIMAYCPAEDIGFASGANMTSFELGANPRDTKFNEENWRCFTIDRARDALHAQGYAHD